MAKKNKEKETFNRTTAPMIGAPPFRVLTPTQAGQYKFPSINLRDQQNQSMEGKMIGIIPVMTQAGP